MSDQPRRALVLGAAGFLGTAVVQNLLQRGLAVSALVRDRRSDTEFAKQKLHDRVNLIVGPIEGTARLRQTVALHDIDVVVQCAAGSAPALTHALTHNVLQAIAAVDRRPTLVVPLPATATTQPKFHAVASSGLKVVFARLPALFGPGAVQGWPASLFLRAALGQILLPAADGSPVCDVATAADAMIDLAFDSAAFPEMGRWSEVPSQATGRELLNALKDELGPRLHGEANALQDAVRATLEWYRSNIHRWPAGSTLRAAA